ncbi:hypothetical protein DL546_003290 [Coniochaeta pulveracea]|uniref:Uncharacterized protein n=1 Tax=Coniochaeta pulveracea TaxID=177199 RepID=A0A420Y6Y3_9PEZI|nr:hypothetical protein DL546_003290 [Coniochaeta pulveracea]
MPHTKLTDDEDTCLVPSVEVFYDDDYDDDKLFNNVDGSSLVYKQDMCNPEKLEESIKRVQRCAERLEERRRLQAKIAELERRRTNRTGTSCEEDGERSMHNFLAFLRFVFHVSFTHRRTPTKSIQEERLRNAEREQKVRDIAMKAPA